MGKIMWVFLLGLGALSGIILEGAETPAKKKIVLMTGRKGHGKSGNGIHDIYWSSKLLKVMLDNSNIKDQVEVVLYLNRWPKDQTEIEDAATILTQSEVKQSKKRPARVPFLMSEERIAFTEKLMKRGCGFMIMHYTTFTHPDNAANVLKWGGGYYAYDVPKGQKNSRMSTLQGEVKLGSSPHPVTRGVSPFEMKEEFYFRLRFPENTKGWAPIWIVPALPGSSKALFNPKKVVAWAYERETGGRGFGTSAGHFYANWKHENFRKTILNALAWTAGVEVPKEGVVAKFYSHEEITAALGEVPIGGSKSSKSKKKARKKSKKNNKPEAKKSN